MHSLSPKARCKLTVPSTPEGNRGLPQDSGVNRYVTSSSSHFPQKGIDLIESCFSSLMELKDAYGPAAKRASLAQVLLNFTQQFYASLL